MDELEPDDPIAAIIAGVDQHRMMAEHTAAVLAAEYHALTDEGVNAYSAAVMIGHRWKIT